MDMHWILSLDGGLRRLLVLIEDIDPLLCVDTRLFFADTLLNQQVFHAFRYHFLRGREFLHLKWADDLLFCHKSIIIGFLGMRSSFERWGKVTTCLFNKYRIV